MITAILVLQLTSLWLLGAAARVVLTEKDTGKVVEVNSGTTILLRLGAVPGTGYMWYVRELDEGLSQVEPSRFEANTAGTGEPGALETQVFKFSVRQAGEHRIRLEYARRKDVRKEIIFNINAR